MDNQIEKYPLIADKHRDSDGRIPRRSWFYPPHYHRYGALDKLVSLCSRGYGEIVLHLHHGTDRPDSSDNLECTIRRCLEEYGYFGIFGLKKNIPDYGFIHGNWAFDNSRGGQYCGVDNELEILIKTGCYADFTHPSLPETTPDQMNSIFYAEGKCGRSKSYNTGVLVRKNVHPDGLMIVQGPLHPIFKGRNPFSLRSIGDAIDGSVIVNLSRMDKWVQAGISVAEKENWIFIKSHTHGLQMQKVFRCGNRLCIQLSRIKL